MNPLDWSFGWTLAAIFVALLVWIAYELVRAWFRGPWQCPRCEAPVPIARQAEHDRAHADLDAAFDAAKAEHFQDVCDRAFGDDPTPHIGGAA